MTEKGWIKLHRQLQDCWIWQEKEPFDMRSAWIDLLLTANHSDKKILFGGKFIFVKKGQILTSVRKLSDKWNWSTNKVYRFLKLLISDEMLQKESDNSRTLLTIVNYSVYQVEEYTDEHTNECTIDTQSDTVSNTSSERKQECKESKNDKNDKENIVRNPDYYSDRKEVIDYLNQKLGTRYRETSQNTVRHINARLSENFTVDDFKTVIDSKYDEWFENDKMRQYLRPDTLFGSKFESYLNNTKQNVKKSMAEIQVEQLIEQSMKKTENVSFYDTYIF